MRLKYLDIERKKKIIISIGYIVKWSRQIDDMEVLYSRNYLNPLKIKRHTRAI